MLILLTHLHDMILLLELNILLLIIHDPDEICSMNLVGGFVFEQVLIEIASQDSQTCLKISLILLLYLYLRI